MSLQPKKGYRSNVGMVISNQKGQLFWGRRARQTTAWQFPQGGVDVGESIEHALYRELQEELGLPASAVRILTRAKDWVSYTIPPEFRRRSSASSIIGQNQRWFLLELLVEESVIQLDACSNPEFDRWYWIDYWDPIDQVIYFKQAVYRQVLQEFFPVVQAAFGVGLPNAASHGAAGR